jgi:hypothetical protein
LGYAKAAERVLGEDATYINDNQELVPVFVNLLFQSLEISLKHLGLEAGLFTQQEARDRTLTKNGHGIKELATLVNSRLGTDSDDNYPVVMALTAGNSERGAEEYLHKMLFAKEFESSRNAYQTRNLGYSQLSAGELKLLDGLKPWVTAIRVTAENLPTAIGVVTQWKNSPSQSKHFAIWYR